MAASLKSALNVDSELIASSGGVFEISVDGRKIFSKKALGRFPDDGEILKAIQGAG